VKQLQGIDPPQYRLRIGDWRFIFRHPDPDTIEVLRVRNRREAASVGWPHAPNFAARRSGPMAVVAAASRKTVAAVPAMAIA